MRIKRTSMFTGNVNIREIDITVAQIQQWRNGGIIQNVMPHLGPDDREFLMTGVTPEEWDRLLPPEES